MNLVDLLKSKIGADEIMSVFCNLYETDSFVCGQIAYIDDDYFVMKHWTKYGRYDGYVIRKTENIFRVDHATYYEKTIDKLTMKSQLPHKEYIPSCANNIIIDFLNFAKSNGYVVSVDVNDSDLDLVGFVREIDEKNNTFSVEHIDDYGNLDGFSTILCESVFRLNCDGEKEIKFQTLYEMNDLSE